MLASLTPNIVNEIHQSTGKKLRVVVQFLQRVVKENKPKLYFAAMSDGTFKCEMVLHPETLKEFESQVQPKDVIEISSARKNEKYPIVVLDFKIVYSKVPIVIGLISM